MMLARLTTKVFGGANAAALPDIAAKCDEFAAASAESTSVGESDAESASTANVPDEEQAAAKAEVPDMEVAADFAVKTRELRPQ